MKNNRTNKNPNLEAMDELEDNMLAIVEHYYRLGTISNCGTFSAVAFHWWERFDNNDLADLGALLVIADNKHELYNIALSFETVKSLAELTFGRQTTENLADIKQQIRDDLAYIAKHSVFLEALFYKKLGEVGVKPRIVFGA